jgi:hypothetical protein
MELSNFTNIFNHFFNQMLRFIEHAWCLHVLYYFFHDSYILTITMIFHDTNSTTRTLMFFTVYSELFLMFAAMFFNFQHIRRQLLVFRYGYRGMTSRQLPWTVIFNAFCTKSFFTISTPNFWWFRNMAVMTHSTERWRSWHDVDIL